MKRKTYAVEVIGSSSATAHSHNSAIRASEALIREIARAEDDIYEGDDPIYGDAAGGCVYIREWRARRTDAPARVEIREVVREVGH